MFDQDELYGSMDFPSYLRALRRRKWHVVALVVFGLVAGGLITLVMKRTYTASTVVLVPQDVQSSVDPSQPNDLTSTEILDRQIQDEINFAQGTVVRQAVRQELGRVPTVSITQLSDSDDLLFKASASSAERAARYADDYASVYLQQRRQSQTQDYLSTAAILRREISGLRAKEAGLARSDPSRPALQGSLSNLESSLSQLVASGQLSRAGGEITSYARVPGSPSSPSLPLNLLVAGFLGLAAGLWLALVLDHLDKTVKSTDDIARATELPGLGVIPWVDSWDHPEQAFVIAMEAPTDPAAEAYRTARAALDRVRAKQGIHTIAVTSAGPGDGKTATVANLAVTMAAAGSRVAVVDCDLRRPRVDGFLGLQSELGLTSILLDDRRIDQVLQVVPDAPNLSVLLSGAPLTNPSEFLALHEVDEVIQWLGHDAGFDVVLVDCPPVLPVPDALQLAQMVDGVIFVVAAGRTKKQEIARAMELLRGVDAPVLGTVLNGVRREDGSEYGYYGYKYESRNGNGRTGSGRSAPKGATSSPAKDAAES